MDAVWIIPRGDYSADTIGCVDKGGVDDVLAVVTPV